MFVEPTWIFYLDWSPRMVRWCSIEQLKWLSFNSLLNIVRQRQQILLRSFHSTITKKPTTTATSRFLLTNVSSGSELVAKVANGRSSMLVRLLSSDAHNHSKIWVFEKICSAALLAVIPAALAFPNPILDYALALSLVAHVHWGFEAIVVDYIRPSLVGPVIPKISLVALYLVSIWALAGLFYMNYSDVGFCTITTLINYVYLK